MTDARRGFTLFLALGAISLALIVVSALRQFEPVQVVVDGVTLPVQRVLSPVATSLRDVTEGLTSGARLQEENRRLRQQVQQLTAENVRLQQLQYENDQLRRQLGFTAANPGLRVVNAAVVGRDPASVRQYLVVDKGSSSGLQPGMAVVSLGGALVGRIASVTPARAEVLLITDTDSSVNAKVERTQADGIVEGQWQQGSFLKMRYIEQGNTPEGAPRVKKGDWIVTSQLGGNLPAGLLIGQVSAVQQVDTGLEQQADVLPAVDVRSVTNVLIVKTAGS